MISAKSAFESLGDDETAFAAALAVGITIIFAGFLLTNSTTGSSRSTPSEEPAAIPADTSVPDVIDQPRPAEQAANGRASRDHEGSTV